jgi:hypothetical protein
MPRLTFDFALHALSTVAPRRVNAFRLLRSLLREGIPAIEVGNLLDFVNVDLESQTIHEAEVEVGGGRGRTWPRQGRRGRGLPCLCSRCFEGRVH